MRELKAMWGVGRVYRDEGVVGNAGSWWVYRDEGVVGNVGS